MFAHGWLEAAVELHHRGRLLSRRVEDCLDKMAPVVYKRIM